MEDWLQRTAAYIPAWIDYQLRNPEQIGCLLAIMHEGELVLEYAVGSANVTTGELLTPRHRFRVASHSKSFTAAGLMLLRERGRLKLDDTIGAFIPGLHDDVAKATLAQVMSHSAGLTRDGSAGNQFTGFRPFLDRAELLSDFAKPHVLDRNTRFKYSNHGFALLGLVIEAVANEPYAAWIRREVVAPFGLTETEPAAPLTGHTLRPRPHRQGLAWSPPTRPRRLSAERPHTSCRFRQHRRRPRPVLRPALAQPGAAEIEVTGPSDGRVALAAGYDGHGESVRLVRDETGAPIEFWTRGVRFAPEAVVAKEMRDLYGPPVGA